MDFNFYKKLIQSLKIGKHLPEAKYLHRSAFEALQQEFHLFLSWLEANFQISAIEYDIIKFSTRDFKVSLLQYPILEEQKYVSKKFRRKTD